MNTFWLSDSIEYHWIEQISNEFQFDFSPNSSFHLIINSTLWWNPWELFAFMYLLQSDPNQNFWFQKVVALKQCSLLYVSGLLGEGLEWRHDLKVQPQNCSTSKCFCFMYHNFDKQRHTFIAYPERNIWDHVHGSHFYVLHEIRKLMALPNL